MENSKGKRTAAVDGHSSRDERRGASGSGSSAGSSAASSARWNPHGQTYQHGQSFGQGGYGAYGADSPPASLHGSQASGEAVSSGELLSDDASNSRPAELASSDPLADETSETENSGRRSHWQREAVSAGEVMTSRPKCATRAMSLSAVAGIMKTENCGIVPVVDDDNKLVGVITDRDIVVRAGADGRSLAETRAEEIMTIEVDAVTSDEDVRDVIALMGKRQVRRVPVVDAADHVVGVIAMADVANRADYDEELQEALERISSRRSFWSRMWG